MIPTQGTSDLSGSVLPRNLQRSRYHGESTLNTERKDLAMVSLLLIAVVIVAALMVLNHAFILPNIRGWDFTSLWTGTRRIIIDQADPYSEISIRLIQLNIYGHNAGIHQDPYPFHYPYYIVFISIPFALIRDQAWAASLWLTLLEAALFLFGWMALVLARYEPKPIVALLYGVLVFLGVHSFSAFNLGDTSILVYTLFLGGIFLLRKDRPGMAGIMMAMATVRIELIVFLLLVTFIWLISRGIKGFFTAFWTTLGAMLFFTFLIKPTWVMGYLISWKVNLSNTFLTNPRDVLIGWFPEFGGALATILTVTCIILFILEVSLVWKKRFHWFYWTLNLVLPLTFLSGISTSPVFFFVMIPGLVLILRMFSERISKNPVFSGGIILVLLGIPWWLVLMRGGNPVEHLPTVLAILYPLVNLIGLYWVRWWYLKPLADLAIGERIGLSL